MSWCRSGKIAPASATLGADITLCPRMTDRLVRAQLCQSPSLLDVIRCAFGPTFPGALPLEPCQSVSSGLARFQLAYFGGRPRRMAGAAPQIAPKARGVKGLRPLAGSKGQSPLRLRTRDAGGDQRRIREISYHRDTENTEVLGLKPKKINSLCPLCLCGANLFEVR